MTEIKYLQQQIISCRKYEARVKTEHKKAEARGIRRDLEYVLDKSKIDWQDTNPWPRYDLGWKVD